LNILITVAAMMGEITARPQLGVHILKYCRREEEKKKKTKSTAGEADIYTCSGGAL
jgi:hypothetical protein